MTEQLFRKKVLIHHCSRLIGKILKTAPTLREDFNQQFYTSNELDFAQKTILLTDFQTIYDQLRWFPRLYKSIG
jgi:hypothetical protein